MNSLIRLAIGLAALTAALPASADDLQVALVVNLTDAGRKIVRPDAAHPAYYYPISKGYTEGGQVLNNMAPPPTDWDVLHTIAKALYSQGYRIGTKEHQPGLLLIFWWGYKAPVMFQGSGDLHSATGGGGFISAAGMAAERPGSSIMQLAEMGELPTGVMANQTDMEELVMGSGYETHYNGSSTLQAHPNILLQQLRNASRESRFYVLISALDFSQALKKNFIVYWTARVSTPIYGRTLAEVIPTLMADVAPSLGRDTGPQITDRPEVPEGKVIVGTPTLVTAHPASAK